MSGHLGRIRGSEVPDASHQKPLGGAKRRNHAAKFTPGPFLGRWETPGPRYRVRVLATVRAKLQAAEASRRRNAGPPRALAASTTALFAELPTAARVRESTRDEACTLSARETPAR